MKEQLNRQESNRISFAKAAAFVALLLSVTNSLAADPKVEALFAKMRQAYSSIKTARFETVSVNRIAGPQNFDSRIAIYDIHVRYKRPDVVRALVASGGHALLKIATVGRKALAVNGKVFPARDSFVSIVGPMQANLESLCFWDWLRQLSTDVPNNMDASTFQLTDSVPWNGKRWIVLEEIPNGADELIDYYIDPKTYFIWRTYVRTKSSRKEQQDAQLKSLVINVPISDQD